MNSETFKEWQEKQVLEQSLEKDRISAAENETIGLGQISDQFMRHPAWKVYDKDLVKVRDDLINKLITGSNLTKAQMETLRTMVKLIDLFRKTPLKYLERMKALAMRKHRK